MDGIFILSALVTAVLLIGWIWIVVAPLTASALGAIKVTVQRGLRKYYGRLPRRLQRGRVSVFHFQDDQRTRIGRRLERELHRALQASLPGAEACACLRERRYTVEGCLRVWKNGRSALIAINEPSLAGALGALKRRLRGALNLPWRAGESECANCNSIACPMHWRHIATRPLAPLM